MRHRLHAVAFAGVVAAGNKGHAAFAGVVGLGLRDFASNKCVGSGGNGVFKVALRAAGAPGDAPHRPRFARHQHHRTAYYRLHMGGQRGSVGKTTLRWLSQPAELLLAKAHLPHQPEALAELRVVAPKFVGVQRQVVGKKVDIVRQQQRQALAHPAGHAAVVAAPKQTVVHQDRISVLGHSGLNQGQTGGHTAHQLAHRAPTLNLQAVGAVIFKARGLQHRVQGS